MHSPTTEPTDKSLPASHLLTFVKDLAITALAAQRKVSITYWERKQTIKAAARRDAR